MDNSTKDRIRKFLSFESKEVYDKSSKCNKTVHYCKKLYGSDRKTYRTSITNELSFMHMFIGCYNEADFDEFFNTLKERHVISYDTIIFNDLNVGDKVYCTGENFTGVIIGEIVDNVVFPDGTIMQAPPERTTILIKDNNEFRGYWYCNWPDHKMLDSIILESYFHRNDHNCFGAFSDIEALAGYVNSRFKDAKKEYEFVEGLRKSLNELTNNSSEM